MRFKKFLCYLLCGVLTFGVISTANYKSAHAMEWVSGALSFAETLTWVLASLGITCTVSDYATEVDKSRSEFWEDYEQDFYDYVNEHNGNTASDRFIEWKNKLCKGVLDKSSEYWGIFKAWASELVNGTSDNNFPASLTVSNLVSYLQYYYGVSYSVNLGGHGNENIVAFDAHTYSNGSRISARFYITNGTYSYNNLTNLINCSSGNFYFYLLDGTSVYGTQGAGGVGGFGTENNAIAYNIGGWPYTIVGGGSATGDTNFDSVTSNVDDLDVISSDGVDEDSPEVTLPYPGVSDSDDSISSDAYQDIIDAINDGTISQEDGVIQIQDLLRIITYDTVTDDVVPPIKDDDGNNKKKDDVLKENKQNAGFSLGGLEAVFPFCIPFDIYAFMTLLVAEPVAPEFDFPIQSVNGQEEEIHVDLSPFEPVAVVVRYCFDFLFIIGLGLITRQLIGAGGGD